MADDLEPIAGFIDTNVWLYAFIDSDDALKTSQARQLIQSILPVINVQVLNEVCVNLLRRKIFDEPNIAVLIASFFQKYRVATTTESVLLNASQLRGKYSLSFWDSLIVSAALASGVEVLYTEDMQNGLMIEGKLKITNPFVSG